MYWSRRLADHLSITAAIIDLHRRRTVSHRWEDWKSEGPWMPRISDSEQHLAWLRVPCPEQLTVTGGERLAVSLDVDPPPPS